MFVSVYKDVIFIEGTHSKAKAIKSTSIELMGIGAQLRNLRDVKERLYHEVKVNKGNCLMDFSYGQKQRLLAFDDVAFYGGGTIAELPEEIYQKYLKPDDEDEE